MSSSTASLEAIETDITQLKEEKRKLESRIEAFENDKSPKDEFSRIGNLKDKDRLTALENRLTTLENRRLEVERRDTVPQVQRKYFHSLIQSIHCFD